MENVTRQTSKHAALMASIRLDNSAAHFKNNKLSDNLNETLDVLFRKRNQARIHSGYQQSETRKDYEYLLAVQEVAKREHGKTKRISTSASTRQRSAKLSPGNVQIYDMDKSQKSGQGKERSTNSSRGRFGKPKQQQQAGFPVNIRRPQSGSSRHSSPSSVSDFSSETDTDNEPEASATPPETSKVTVTRAPAPVQRKAVQQTPSSETNRQTTRARRHENKVWAVDNTNQRPTKSAPSHFRYTRGPSYNASRKNAYVVPTKAEFLMQTVVYDPGDVYLTSRRRSYVNMSASRKRPKTALGTTSGEEPQDEDCYSGVSRQCQSASLSRRKLMEMNNIDALIESSETPLFLNKKTILLESSKRDFDLLQMRVNRFLERVKGFNNRSAIKREQAMFFLDV